MAIFIQADQQRTRAIAAADATKAPILQYQQIAQTLSLNQCKPFVCKTGIQIAISSNPKHKALVGKRTCNKNPPIALESNPRRYEHAQGMGEFDYTAHAKIRILGAIGL